MDPFCVCVYLYAVCDRAMETLRQTYTSATRAQYEMKKCLQKSEQDNALQVGPLQLHSPSESTVAVTSNHTKHTKHQNKSTKRGKFFRVGWIARITTRRRASSACRLLFKNYMPHFFVVSLIAFLFPMLGVQAVQSYANSILEQGGWGSSSLVATVGLGVVKVLFTVVAIAGLEKWGRRPMLLLGATIMTFGMVAVSVSFTMSVTDPNLLLIGLAVMVAGYQIGYGTVLWVLATELFPSAIRGTVISLVSVVAWSLNAVVVMNWLLLCDAIGIAAVAWFAVFVSIVLIAFQYACVPETRNMSTQEISLSLRQRLSSFVITRWCYNGYAPIAT